MGNQPQQRFSGTWIDAGIGLVIGAGLGFIIGFLFLDQLVYGLITGATAGLIIGAVLDAISRRQE
jgi:uncharacterized membrane protein